MADRSLVFKLIGRDVSASKTFDKVGTSADRLGQKSRSTAKLVGGAFAGAAVVAFGKKSVTAFAEAENAQVRLETAYARFPKVHDVTIASFDRLANSIQNSTKFDDEAVKSSASVLAQYDLTGQQIQELLPLVSDYAARTGKDLPSAATAVGKAMLGQGRALKEVGIRFKDTGTTAGNYDQIMGGLRKQVGGFATAEGKTAAGQAAILRNKFEELQERVGAKLVPVLMTMAGWLIKTADFIQRNQAWLVPLVGTLATAAVTFMAVNKVIAITNVVLRALGVSTTVALGPIGLIIIAVAALAAGLFLAYKKSETFRNIVNAAFNAVKNTVMAVINFILPFIKTAFSVLQTIFSTYFNIYRTVVVTAFNVIRSVVTTVMGVLRSVVGAASTAITTSFRAIDRVGITPTRKAIETLRDIWSNSWAAMQAVIRSAWDVIRPIADAISGAVGKIAGAVGKVSGFVGSVGGRIPGFATGGVVPGPIGAPRLVVVHGGEEVLTPRQRAERGTSVDTSRLEWLVEQLIGEMRQNTRAVLAAAPGLNNVAAGAVQSARVAV